jgi:Fe-S-cluster containining protein
MNQEPPFARTVCACRDCIKCCYRQPGPLVPGDYEAIQAHLGKSTEEMAKLFWASPGALIKSSQTGAIRRVGTITPQRRKGKCVFLDENERCRIHSVAPFGCAYFDTHMNVTKAHRRGIWMANSQTNEAYQELRKSLPYANSYKPSDY